MISQFKKSLKTALIIRKYKNRTVSPMLVNPLSFVMLNIQLTFNTTQLVFQRFNCLKRKKKTHLINCFIFWIQIHLLISKRIIIDFFTSSILPTQCCILYETKSNSSITSTSLYIYFQASLWIITMYCTRLQFTCIEHYIN